MIKIITLQQVRESATHYAGIAGARDAANLVASRIGAADREHLLCLHLDSKNQVTDTETISIGTLNSSLVHPREVYKGALANNAARIILAHNHPSGDSTPSKEDGEVTRRIAAAGHLLGIPLLDHIIVGAAGEYYSYAEAGAMPKARKSW